MRVFIGIPLHGRCQRRIDELLGTAMPAKGDWRWIPEQNRHLTLAFMGDQPLSVLQELGQSFSAAYRSVEAFQYRFSALQRFPGPGARLIALTGERTPPMDHLLQVTRTFLQRVGVSFERKSFRPHITLAKAGRPGRGSDPINVAADIRMDIDSVVLYQSTQGRSGSVYSALQTAWLGRTGRDTHPDR